MTQTTTYRNPDTGYTVKLLDIRPGVAKVTTSDGFDFPMIGIDYPHAKTLAASRAHLNGAIEVSYWTSAPEQMTSPLAPANQVRSARPLANGANLTMPTLPQARCLAWAAPTTDGRTVEVRRGNASVIGATAPYTVLQAMARRGWLLLDHDTRPTYGVITTAGRNALAAYVAKHGEVL